MAPEKKITIVTGASHNHFSCLLNFLYSLFIFNVNARILVYDLGLSEAERLAVSKFPVILNKLEYENYPSFIKISESDDENIPSDRKKGFYAWKPVIINEVLEKSGGIVLWLDAGNLVFNNLERVKKIIEINGIYSPLSSDTISKWTYPQTLKMLNVPEDILNFRNRNASVVGFNADYPGIMQLAGQWKKLALNKDCIAPEGSTNLNHRYDQAILTILMYQFQKQFGYRFVDRFIDLNNHNDNLALSDNNKEADLLDFILKNSGKFV
jgi:hypothetical protein